MQTYSTYAPTSYDARGAFLPERADWLVLSVTRTRDSDQLAESNWEAALDMLGGESDTVEVHSFGHWACGWLEKILIAPDTPAAEIAERIESNLADYPVLDEDDWSDREFRSYLAQWDDWGATEFTRDLTSIFRLSDATSDYLDTVDKDHMRTFFESLNESGDYHEDGSPVIRRSIENATRMDVARFIRDQRRKTSPEQNLSAPTET